MAVLSIGTSDLCVILNCLSHQKNHIDDLICKAEREIQTWRTNIWIPRQVGMVRGNGRLGLPYTHCWFGLSHSVVSNSLQPSGLYPARLLYPWDSPGKNTGMGCHALFREIFPTQGSNPGLPHCRRILYHLSHQGSPIDTKYKINNNENILHSPFLN